jgi:4-hydroxy-4-methyl-2-oxoglutarate aldolase
MTIAGGDPSAGSPSFWETFDNTQCKRILELGTATLYEAAGQIGALPSLIASTASGQTLCGRAFPVQVAAGDNLALHHAIYAAQPTDILVVSASGGREFGYFGEVMARAAMAIGIAGLVIDGGVRDADRMAKLGFPVFATARCVRGTTKRPDAVLCVGGEIALGDVSVRSGDLVVGDGDGVIVLPSDRAYSALAAADQRESKEALIFERLASGESTIDIYGLPLLPGAS